MAQKEYNEINGVLIVDKPEGMTSHDVVDFIRRRFKIKKVGHAGTLDPQACGLLVLLLGKSTRLQNRFINDDKVYEATLTLGIKTDTQDREGKQICVKDPSFLTHEDIRATFGQFAGEQEQIPPMYSAVKHKGKKLYELARLGRVVERKVRRIRIYNLEILRIEIPYVSFTVHCSKGTYIRQLCSDIGDRLRCGAYMHYLKRTKSGRFSIGEAAAFNKLKTLDVGLLPVQKAGK